MHRSTALFLVVPAAGLIAACGSSSSSSSSGGNSAYCGAAQTVKTDQTTLGATLGPSTTISQLHTAMASFAAHVDAADAAAPSQIAGDWHTIRAGVDSANTQVQAATTLQQAGQALATLSTSANDQAGQRIDAETQRQCGFTIGTPTPAPGGGSTGSSSTDTGSSSVSSSSSSTDTGSSSSSSTDTGTTTSSSSSS